VSGVAFDPFLLIPYKCSPLVNLSYLLIYESFNVFLSHFIPWFTAAVIWNLYTDFS
jgi:hypothetical protein